MPPPTPNRGAAKERLGQHDAAFADYDRAIELDPNYAAAYSNRGAAKERLGQHDAALADHNRAIELDPTLAIAYSNRGNAKERLGQHDAAFADYDRAIELDPNLCRPPTPIAVPRRSASAASARRERIISKRLSWPKRLATRSSSRR